MNATENVTTPPCGIFNPLDCAADELNDQDRYLALVVLALACAVVSLCVLILVLAVLVHKLSAIWVATLLKTAEAESNDASKGLLHGIRSSFRPKDKQKKKTTFAEDTSCAAPRDIDEEDL
tara:strand:+ start:27 stop:389 length:363 start_codon:yes stop_codon:yes gene_type:complete